MSRLVLRALSALLLVLSTPAFATNELFEIYQAPQALAMGNAWTSEAYGYAALFHNPAGLAKAESNKWVITPVAIEGTPGTNYIGAAATQKKVGLDRLLPTIQADPNNYYYFKATAIPSISRRNFALAFVANSDAAAVSDGTFCSIRYGNDFGIFAGVATNLAANMIKIGVTGKAILRNQVDGLWSHATLSSAAAIEAVKSEGIGLGADVGVMFTLPTTYLPTLGIVWKDILNTNFQRTYILNPNNIGAPAPIQQSLNAAFSFRPALAKGVRALFTAEMRHIEMLSLPFEKKLHFGFQIQAHKRLFIWAGMSQLIMPTFGLGLRVPGGDLEVGTYAQDVGQGATYVADRRILFRYTISF
ncbi:hypothetical protein K2X33_03515 [bacterium]|nr:hypothetical protein [bacterium]